MLKKLTLLLLLCGIVVESYAQTAQIDSLRQLIWNGSSDSVQILSKLELAYTLRDMKSDTSLLLIGQGLEASIRLDFKKGIGRGYGVLGIWHRNKGNIPQATEFSFKSLKIVQQIQDFKYVALVLSNIGTLYYEQKNHQKALEYYQKALLIQEKLQAQYGQAVVYNNLGRIHLVTKQYPKALLFYQKGIFFTKEDRSKSIKGLLFCNIAETYMEMRNYQEALQNAKISLEIAQEIKRKRVVARSQIILGETYFLMGNSQKAVLFLEEGTKTAIELGLPEEKIAGLEYTYKAHEKIGNFEKALFYYKSYKTLNDTLLNKENYNHTLEREHQHRENQRKIERKQEIMIRSALLGGLFLVAVMLFVAFRAIRSKAKSLQIINAQTQQIQEKNEELQKSNQIIELSYKNITQLNQIGREITASLNLEIVLETIYLHINQLMDATIFGIGVYDEKKNSIEYRMAISKGIRYKPYTRSMEEKNQYPVWCIDHKSEIFINDVSLEYKNYLKEEENIDFEDGENEEKALALIYVPMLIKEKVIGIITVQSFEKNVYQDHHLTFLQSIASYASIALENSLAYQQIEKQQIEIAEKNNEFQQINEELQQQQEELLVLNESLDQKRVAIQKTYLQFQEANEKLNKNIEYAFHIQSVILAEKAELEAFFKDLFIIYKPRDVVSGDFYWFYEANPKQAIFVLADCTGHGVSGAFMSMLGSSLLYEIVVVKKIDSPAQILSLVHSGLQGILKQNKGKNSDGMDIGISLFEKQETQVKICFAGARTSLYYFDKELMRISGDKQIIGGKITEKVFFENKEIGLPYGTSYYFFTDGFIDQNDPDRKRFGTKNFELMLQNLQNYPFSEQKKQILTVLNNFQKNEEQRDDISVLGFCL